MRNFIRKLLILSYFISVVSSNVFAEDVELSKIVVTASRVEEKSSGVARKIDVITAEDIERSQAQDLAQVLTGLTSVNMSDYGGPGATKTIRMRGSAASQVLVLVDGRPINNPRDGTAELSTIPLGNIKKIEVMHGPGSSLYGAGAMGGTVNIITKNPPKEKQETELTSSFGTFRTYNENFSHGARISNFGYLITGGYQNSEGYRANSEFDAKDLSAKLEYEFNDNNTVTLNSGFDRNKQGVPGNINASDIDDKQVNIKNFQDLGWNFEPDDTTALSVRAYQNYDRLEFIENTSGSAFDAANNRDAHTTKARGGNLQLSKELFNYYQGILGLSYLANFNDSSASGKHEYDVRAVYLENKFDLFNERLKLNFGSRLDDYSNFGTEINPSFSLLYALRDNVRFHGLISRSFRAPTFNDLYWPDEGWAKGNPDLSPEKGITEEIGVESEINKHLTSGITYYRSDYKDLINWAESSGVWQPMNVNSALIDGIEFENRIKITDNWGLDASYTYLCAKDADSHKYLIYQPRHKVDLSLKYITSNGFVCELKEQFVDKRFHDAENLTEVKKFFVLGLSVSKKFKSGITCFAAIDNLLARKYQVIKDYPMPGFSLTSGLKVEF
ncbi:MAG: hypothetical protein COS99_04365 [Candidatus Omnitrophica bacterium CG07_land_8_20_14_0_80_42_15]|uniref:TonB-dependent receptor n=1 Tax=Candidatus Aquitaenariimonas noxiae TaxID=1974741 RepID=A0A2J0L0L5_9BACT|nr:MAG: hypothetical protein COS99_04365 [Candidatus Omnitrophica bacterium CG07_land_8_20_14_0_80_42_15]